MSLLAALAVGAIALSADASAVIASDVIRAGDRVTLANVTTEEGDTVSAENPLIGQEVRRTVYKGQAITPDNTRAPMLVKRNQVVTLKYINGALEITTTGRALGEAGLNETVTVLNQSSKQTVQGVVQESGWVLAQ
ncbi:MAG TPA: flagellar basal body P-ring formation chaperone FlgA [Hyphomonas sp.]|nr:flagellar basal body P-ring formation protein FlgA [Hyphomonas sp.]MCB9972549.1 flagellar basal body P-ring formation protein FlgA [Hyphomonas sp.]HPE46802.1 flagellar basal body P-ring formation chaperone FlgA [Hyphomonas sp.]